MPRAAGARQTTRHAGVYAVTTAAGTRYESVWRDASGRQRSSTHARLADAVAARAAALTARSRGVELPTAADRRVTVADVAAAWLAAGLWRDSTRAAHESILRGHVLPAFGMRRVGTVRPSDVASWVAAQHRAGAAASTITARRNVLAAVLAVAVGDGLIPSNPATGVRVPSSPRTPEQRAAALTSDQLGQLLDELPPHLRTFALVLSWAGLRPSEAAGLTVDRVDELHGTLVVDRQLVAAHGRTPRFGPPKTPASVRTLPLGSELAAALRAHVDSTPLGVDGLLFTTRTGAPIGRSVRSDAWRRAAARVELPPAVRGWHALRHTYASTMLAAGVELPTVSRLLGHASVVETATTYAHALPGRDVAVRDVAARALPFAVGSQG